MRFVKYMTAPILMAALCSFWGCDKDEDHLSEAVLASANTLNFEAERAAEKIITIYADADWVTEVPDWVTVSGKKMVRKYLRTSCIRPVLRPMII